MRLRIVVHEETQTDQKENDCRDDAGDDEGGTPVSLLAGGNTSGNGADNQSDDHRQVEKEHGVATEAATLDQHGTGD